MSYIYTDGSKTTDGVGSAAIIQNITIKITSPNEASLFTAELRAIQSAVKILPEHQSINFTIFSDWRSALQTICNPFTDHPLANDIQTDIHGLHQTGKTVNLCWVPSHVGVPGNERADKAALEAANANIIPPTSLPSKDYYPVFNSYLRNDWQNEWTMTDNNKLRRIKLTINPWTTSYRKQRREETILTRLRIGHTRLTHSYLLTGTERPYCDNCIVPLTIDHILSECPDYNRQRLTIYQTDPVHTQTILKNDKATIVRLFQYINMIGLQDDI